MTPLNSAPAVAASPLAPAWLTPPDDQNALDPRVWPATAQRDQDGALRIGGVSVVELADRFGTPLYVLDEADVRDRAAAVLRAFQQAAASAGVRAHVYYAGKAFLSVAVARWMQQAGLRIDVCTGGELAVALAAGVDPARLGYHGNNKSRAEIDRAVQVGVGAIVLDSVAEIDRVADAADRHGRTQPVRLRVNSGVHASTHEYLATAREDQKFGIALPDVPGAVTRIRARASLRFLGLHSHIGSQIAAVDGFAEAARRLLTVHRDLLAGGDVPELNLGGGFGVAYTAADDPAPIDRLAADLVAVVQRECMALGIPVPDLAVEPGRSIIGPGGVTLYTAGTVKDVEVALPAGGTAPRRYLSVDGGMSDNVRAALYGADYTALLASRTAGSDAVLTRVAGKHCESGDVVVRDAYLPGDIDEGDLVAVAVTGAYHHALASNYNLIGRPPVVAVREGRATVLVRGETIDDLLARDTAFDGSASNGTAVDGTDARDSAGDTL
ncbi:diaminopimelate decarboxylase [uncultured Amnibacterium sp.]|uniref:diaminopimelate decarboxylase n=1 Tax=uncultured Amnibacterium sp. TaxID=1631851 RepID=UPI0035CBADED